jgi:hypothetical protein
MLKHLLLFIIVGFVYQVQAQQIPDSLIKYRHNKQLLSSFELESLQALWHYPELMDTKIRFKEKSLSTTMACRPVWYTLFCKRSKRTYNIVVNNSPAKIGNAILLKVPQVGRIGVIGHELGHVTDYASKNTLGIAWFGIKYLFIPSRSKIEKQTDRIAIQHQVGQNIYEFDLYIQNNDSIPESYKAYKRRVYYSADEIKKLMDEAGL